MCVIARLGSLQILYTRVYSTAAPLSGHAQKRTQLLSSQSRSCDKDPEEQIIQDVAEQNYERLSSSICFFFVHV